MLSFVLPAYNEEKNIEYVYQEIVDVMQRDYSEYEYEVIFVDDGSKDMTWNCIQKLAEQDTRLKGISLARNFGKEIALSA